MQCLHLKEGDEHVRGLYTNFSHKKIYQLVDKVFPFNVKIHYLILSRLTCLKFHNLFWFTSKQVKFKHNLVLEKKEHFYFLPTLLNSTIIANANQSRLNVKSLQPAGAQGSKWTQAARWRGTPTVLYIQVRLRQKYKIIGATELKKNSFDLRMLD